MVAWTGERMRGFLAGDIDFWSERTALKMEASENQLFGAEVDISRQKLAHALGGRYRLLVRKDSVEGGGLREPILRTRSRYLPPKTRACTVAIDGDEIP